MLDIKINGKDYKLEYSFASAEHNDTVKHMFNVLSGAYVMKEISNVKSEKDFNVAMMRGTSEMVADIPKIVKSCFYSGLLENHNVSEAEAYDLMKSYMKENKISYRKLFEDIKTCMETDGFFDLSGLVEMLAEMESNIEQSVKKMPKTPQDHKKKSTGTK